MIISSTIFFLPALPRHDATDLDREAAKIRELITQIESIASRGEFVRWLVGGTARISAALKSLHDANYFEARDEFDCAILHFRDTERMSTIRLATSRQSGFVVSAIWHPDGTDEGLTAWSCIGRTPTENEDGAVDNFCDAGG